MNKYQVGDVVQVRTNLSREERGMWPSFVPQMDATMGMLYRVKEVVSSGEAYYLNICDLNPNAPSPEHWLYAEQWLSNILEEEIEDDIDTVELMALL